MLIRQKLPVRLFLSTSIVLVVLWSTQLCKGQNSIIRLPESINTDAYDEIAFLSDSEGTQFYFTRTGSPDLNHRLYANGIDVGSRTTQETFEHLLSQVYTEISGQYVSDPIASTLNQDIHVAERIDDSWIVQHPDYPMNSALPNSVIGVLNEPEGLFVLNHFYESGNMYEGVSKMYLGGDGGVSFPKPIFVKNIDSKSKEISAFISSDGEVAIFALRKTGGPMDTDLYVSFFTGVEDIWSTPKNIGVDINTRYRESTPFLSADKRRIFFASDRPGGQGGTNIYVSHRQSFTYNKWTQPKPVHADINSEADESHPCYVESTQDFYFASNRAGSFDIYQFKPSEKKEIREITITGRIINKETGTITGADLYYGPEQFADYLEYYSTFNGRFKMVVRTGELYKFFPKKAGFKTRIQRFDFDEIVPADVTEYEMDLFLYPIKKEDRIERVTKEKKKEDKIFNMTIDEIKHQKTISLHHVQFVRSKSIVLTSSKPYLNELYRLMDEHPDISILIAGHTDNQGARDLLMKLSEERALAVKGYLIQAGIEPERIRTIGYGPTRPLNANENERDRSLNRRVEFTVLE